MGLQVENLSFSYHCFQVLYGVSFAAKEGNLVCVLGKNGAGKSTFFRCMLGLLKGYQGKVTVDGVDVRTVKTREMASKIAYIPQNHAATFSFSVLDMVLMGTTPSLTGMKTPGPAQKKTALRALEMMNIRHMADRSFAHISGGEQQLVLIARAIAQEAKILIMDEPCANLDYGNQARVMEQLEQLAKKGYLILLSTHSPDQAFLYGDQALVLHNGKVAAMGPPEVVLTQELLEEIYEMPIRLMELKGDGKKYCMPGRTFEHVGTV